jgi:histidyl-tRNA synthetase
VGSVDVFVVAVTAEDTPEAVRLSHTLRDLGVRVEYAMSVASVGKQLKLANARDARFAIVLGPDEREAGQVMLRDLASGEQRTVAAGDVAEELIRQGAVTSHR